MRAFFISIIFLFIHFVGSISASSDSLKIAVITDIHFLSKSLVKNGDALALYENSTGRNVKELHEVFDKVLVDLQNENIDLLLLTGDISNHGELQSHLDLIDKLQPIVNSGATVYVIPGNHDINVPDAKAYLGSNLKSTETISKEDFAELYGAFGYSNALSRDKSSLSYLSEINEKTWLLAFDSNRYGENITTSITGGRIKEETMEWALNLLEEAKGKNIRVLGMMHHGLVEHMPYQNSFFSEYLIDDWQNRADMLADAGLKVIFTGHFHSNDVALRTTTNGNKIYDVETASLAQYPFAYRVMKLNESELSIDTRFITSIPSNQNLEKEYHEKLEVITRKVAESRINSLGIPMLPELKNVVADLMVKLNMAHVRGDEKPDLELMLAIRSLTSFLGNDVNGTDYSFDLPPEDNKLVIDFAVPQSKIYLE